MRLIQIVPALPPAINGLGDYASLLAGELQVRYAIKTDFLVSSTTWSAPAGVTPFHFETVENRCASTLLSRLAEIAPGDTAVLMHYVGYSYARRGCPFWLIDALERWKRRMPGSRLIVLFHELYGSGPIWTSAFWTSGVQKYLAGRLARLADQCRSTTEIRAQEIRTMLPPARRDCVRTLPVFSNVGELAQPVPYPNRRRQMIVFGGGLRRDVYTNHLSDLIASCRQLDLERIIDVGVPIEGRPNLPLPIVEKGLLAVEEITDILAQSAAGFLAYPLPYLGKSGVFAAYCAHGMIPVTITANIGEGDDHLRSNEHFLAGAPTPKPDANTLGRIANFAHTWYQRHRLEIHAREIAQTVLGTAEC